MEQAHADGIWQAVLDQNASIADKKKRRIIEATIHLIAKNGIGYVTFDHVGEELGTTKANIKYHFRDKELLIFTATRLVVINVQMLTARLVEKAPTPQEKLLAIIDASYEWVQRFPEHGVVWLLFMYYAQHHERYAKFFIETRAIGQSRMELLLRALPHQDGSKSLDYRDIAEVIQNLLYGQILGLTGRRKEAKRSRLQSIQLISTVLKAKGIKWPAK